MNQQELEELAASVTPERLRQLIAETPGTFKLKRRTAIAVEALLKELLRGRDAGQGLEYQRVASRLLKAIRQAAAEIPGAVQAERT